MRILSIVAACLLFSSALCAKDKDAKKSDGKMEMAANPVVVFATSLGDFEIELDQAKAPKTVSNFLAYTKEKYYDGTVFHRVINSFMIQGGGFKVDGKTLAQKKTKAPIANEGKNGLKNLTGTIAMARTGDPNSATSQFFINVQDNAGLDYPKPDGHGYAVFGKVTKGMNVINKIKAVKTTMKTVNARGPDGKVRQAPFRDVPETNVVIKTVRLKKAEAKKKS